ncbi:hypothetical protein ACFX13_045178 [Malus domestica]
MATQVRGSAVVTAVIVIELCMALHGGIAHAETFTVGENDGWTFNVENWTKGKTFAADDTLGKFYFNLSPTYIFVHFLFSTYEKRILRKGEIKMRSGDSGRNLEELIRTQFQNVKYNKDLHNVVVVDENGYKTCTAIGKELSSGNDEIKLARGQNYFICGIPGHCDRGQKIAVTAN